MKLYTCLSQFPNISKTVSLMIGTFDGVHTGHMHLLKHLRKKKSESVVVTFANHPMTIISQDPLYPVLFTLEQKVEALNNCGFIDHLIVIPFTKELKEMDYKEFIKLLHDSTNFNFFLRGESDVLGKDREGNFENISMLSHLYKFSTHEIQKFCIDDEIVSSSLIKKALKQGYFEKAKKLLDHSLTFSQLDPRILPRGLYDIKVHYDGEENFIQKKIKLTDSIYTLDKPGLITIEKRISL